MLGFGGLLEDLRQMTSMLASLLRGLKDTSIWRLMDHCSCCVESLLGELFFKSFDLWSMGDDILLAKRNSLLLNIFYS